MYTIEKTTYGLRVRLEGIITETVALQFRTDLERALEEIERPFSSIVDVRSLVPPQPSVLAVLAECQYLGKLMGKERRAVIIESPVIKGQAQRVAFRSETVDSERYINAGATDDWEQLALDWVTSGIEPTYAPAGSTSRPSH